MIIIPYPSLLHGSAIRVDNWSNLIIQPTKLAGDCFCIESLISLIMIDFAPRLEMHAQRWKLQNCQNILNDAFSLPPPKKFENWVFEAVINTKVPLLQQNNNENISNNAANPQVLEKLGV